MATKNSITGKIIIPTTGEKITVNADNSLNVPNQPIIPFIEGDGIGADITPPMIKVVDAAVNKAYGGTKKISWMEVYAGEKATKVYGDNDWLPAETMNAVRDYVVSIKGPLTTPVGGGIRSLNVSLRQELDLYVCLRPVQYFSGVPSPVKHPEKTDMVIFRENTEDIYAGIEWKAGSPEAQKFEKFLIEEMGVKNIRFPGDSGYGVKPVSSQGTKRLVRAAIDYALEHDLPSVTLVHKGNIMKFTEGAFKTWGYEVARQEYGDKTFTWDEWDELKKEHGEAHANEVQRKALHEGALGFGVGGAGLGPEVVHIARAAGLDGLDERCNRARARLRRRGCRG